MKKIFDLDDKDYEKIDSFINSTHKEWGEQREKRDRALNDFTALRQASVYDEATLDKLHEKNPNLYTEDFVKAMKQNHKNKPNPTLVLDDDLNFLNQLNHLSTLTQLPSGDNDAIRMQTMQESALTLNKLNDYRQKYGSSKDTKEAIDEATTLIATNQLFSDSIKNNLLDPNSELGKTIKEAGVLQGFKQAQSLARFITGDNLARKDLVDVFNHSTEGALKGALNDSFENSAEKRKNISAEASRAIMQQSLRYNTPEADTPQGKANIDRDIKTLRDNYNKRLIMAKYQDIVGDQDLLQMEQDLQMGRKPIIVIKDQPFYFKGFTNNSIILANKEY